MKAVVRVLVLLAVFACCACDRVTLGYAGTEKEDPEAMVEDKKVNPQLVLQSK
jgi:hypothetical protein